MPTIKDVFARMIFDSRGNPTVECEVTTEDGVFRAAVPSGASTGIHEALELRDGDPAVFMGKGVTKAIHNVKTELRDAVMGMDVTDQAGIDAKMIEVDGTGRLKKRLGANAILGTHQENMNELCTQKTDLHLPFDFHKLGFGWDDL